MFYPVNKTKRQRLVRGFKKIPGVIAYYPLNEASGTVSFNNAPSNKGALNGAISNATLGSPGLFGKGYAFNGTSSFISIPSANSLNMTGDITMFAVIKRTASDANYRDILTKNNGNFNTQRQYGIGMNNNNKIASKLYNGNSEDQKESSGTIVPLTYYLVAGRRIGTVHDMTINGTVVATGTFGSALNTTGGSLVVGRFAALDSSYFSGTIQHAGVANVGFTNQQLTKLTQLAGLT